MPFDIRLARDCMELSGLAYEDDREGFLKVKGFDLISTYDHDGTQAFLAEKARGGDGRSPDGDKNKSRLFLAFRGTQEFKDFFRDISYVKTDFPGGGRVHAGFNEAFKAVRSDIAFDLRGVTGKELITTGHSLGAALAQLAALAFRADAAYVFGSPRVGNGDFAARFDATRPAGNRKWCSLYRFENRPDPVTWVPYATSPVQAYVSWRQGRPVTLYRHAGFEIKLSRPWHRFFRYRQSFHEYQLALESFPLP